jgi:hypothetical protein
MATPQRDVVGFPSPERERRLTRYTPPEEWPQFLRVDEVCVILDFGRDEGCLFAQQHGEKVLRRWRVSRAVLEKMLRE